MANYDIKILVIGRLVQEEVFLKSSRLVMFKMFSLISVSNVKLYDVISIFRTNG